MSSFEVNIVIDDQVLSCCKCCCCCPIGECNWLDSYPGGGPDDPPYSPATVSHPTAYVARFDFDNAYNNPFPSSVPPFIDYPYNCEGSANLRQAAASTRGFKKTGSGTVTVSYEANLEKKNEGFDCGSFTLYRCIGATDNVVGSGGQVVLTFIGCSPGCSIAECYCDMQSISTTSLTYTELCTTGTAHYRLTCAADTMDENWHRAGFWQFIISGVTTEDCATPALVTLNKRKIRANLLDRMKKLSLTGVKALKNTKFFKPAKIPANRNKILIKGKTWKRIF